MTSTGRALLWRLLLLCVAIRVALQVLGMASVAAHGQDAWSSALSMWSHWDAPHYLRLAEVGYVAGSPPPDDPLFIVFFPFFPLAVSIVSVVFRDLVASGLIVSLAASAGAAWFLHRLIALDRDEDSAWRGVVLLFTFPTAYFLAAPYTEALFLFAVVASMYAARTGRWARSGLAGALATGTRVTGVALLPALAVEALRGPGDRTVRFRRLVWVGFALAGLLTYLAINQVVHGDPLWFLEVQRFHWYQEAIPPWQSIVDAVNGLADGTGPDDRGFIYWGRIAGFVFALPLLVIGVRRLRASHTVYAWGSFVLMLSASWLISLPRYLLVLYPIFIVGADLTRSKRVFYPFAIVGSATQGWLFWRYAVGEWTF